MKKLLKPFKSVFLSFLEGIKELKAGQRIIYFSILFILAVLLALYFKIAMIVIIVVGLILSIISLINNKRFLRDIDGNGIIFGGRGKGKGILLQKAINNQKKAFSNVYYGKHTEIINIKEYIQSIGENTIHNTINNDIKLVKKIEKFEGINVYWDDVGVYAPNFMDHILKKYYPSLSLTLAINRHLYNANMIITSQDRERPYKILKELQTDFSIKALKSVGFGKLWNSVPILRNFIIVKYRYYEEPKTAEAGKLPFKAIGLVNEGVKHAYLTSGQATKETYEAENGKVYNGFIVMRKKKLFYDTRFFHEVFYGYKAKSE